MFKRSKAEAPQRERDGLVSSILLQQGDVPESQLSITWVKVAPGSSQHPHQHLPEQVYVITQGKGRMYVGKEEQEVTVGDLIYIPPNIVHHVENLSHETLTYISAATPAFDLTALYDTGDLRPKGEKRE